MLSAAKSKQLSNWEKGTFFSFRLLWAGISFLLPARGLSQMSFPCHIYPLFIALPGSMMAGEDHPTSLITFALYLNNWEKKILIFSVNLTNQG
jgi:hypothetical protein